jgi:hypothetical protein
VQGRHEQLDTLPLALVVDHRDLEWASETTTEDRPVDAHADSFEMIGYG